MIDVNNEWPRTRFGIPISRAKRGFPRHCKVSIGFYEKFSNKN